MGVNLKVYPESPEGRPVTAPTFEDTNTLQPEWKGYKYVATAGATSIYDEVVTTEKQLRGGWYELLDSPAKAIVGDYVEFAVVDKDDVLGLFSTYGLTVGQDVLELQKYIKNEFVNPARNEREKFIVRSVWTITAGLFLRTIYESTGTEDVTFKVVTFAYE